MTMVDVTLCLVLVGYFLMREEARPGRRPRGRAHGPQHWRRNPGHRPGRP